MKLHAFGDASGKVVEASVYAVVKQATSLNQGLVTAKARLAKHTSPRTSLGSQGRESPKQRTKCAARVSCNRSTLLAGQQHRITL